MHHVVFVSNADESAHFSREHSNFLESITAESASSPLSDSDEAKPGSTAECPAEHDS